MKSEVQDRTILGVFKTEYYVVDAFWMHQIWANTKE